MNHKPTINDTFSNKTCPAARLGRRFPMKTLVRFFLLFAAPLPLYYLGEWLWRRWRDLRGRFPCLRVQTSCKVSLRRKTPIPNHVLLPKMPKCSDRGEPFLFETNSCTCVVCPTNTTGPPTWLRPGNGAANAPKFLLHCRPRRAGTAGISWAYFFFVEIGIAGISWDQPGSDFFCPRTGITRETSTLFHGMQGVFEANPQTKV